MIPRPTTRTRIDIGGVASSERAVDFSASLPSAPLDRATLSWQGGRYLGLDIAGFHIYMSPTAGAAVDYTRPVATIPIYSGGQPIDGYGLGPYGSGGYGYTASNYSWTSQPLDSGSWSFAVVSFDTSGNEGAAVTGTQTITAAPEPPARNASGARLTYTYDPSTHQVTLNWLASPG